MHLIKLFNSYHCNIGALFMLTSMSLFEMIVGLSMQPSMEGIGLTIIGTIGVLAFIFMLIYQIKKKGGIILVLLCTNDTVFGSFANACIMFALIYTVIGISMDMCFLTLIGIILALFIIILKLIKKYV